MERSAVFNNKGVTLIEMMIALVILLIVSLALMQTALIGIKTNLQNILRDEAVSVAEMRMNQLRSLPFPVPPATNDLTATAGDEEAGVVRKFRGFSLTFTPTRIIDDINANSKQVSISVSWTYKGKTYTHGVTSIMRKQV